MTINFIENEKYLYLNLFNKLGFSITYPNELLDDLTVESRINLMVAVYNHVLETHDSKSFSPWPTIYIRQKRVKNTEGIYEFFYSYVICDTGGDGKFTDEYFLESV